MARQRLTLTGKMRRNKGDELARRNDLRVFPERRKVPTIACDEIIGTCRIGTLNKDVVVRITRYLDTARRPNQMAVVLNG